MNDRKRLPKFQLFLDPNDIAKLDDPKYTSSVTGQMMIDNKKFSIKTRYRGHYTKNLPKRSYFVKLKSRRQPREFHLNAEYKDPSSIRNKLSLDLFQAFGVLAPSSHHVRFYLNGEYEGVYLLLESVNELFLKKRGLPLGPIYYGINYDADFSLISPLTKKEKGSLTNGYQRKVGTPKDDLFLIEFIRKINQTPDCEFEKEIQKYLAVDKYLRWLAVAVCTQNLDGFYHNYALYRNPESGLFEIMPWDYDATFGRDWRGKRRKPDVMLIGGRKNGLSGRLFEFPAFRKQYRKLLEELLDTLFTTDYLEPIITSLTETIRPHMIFNDASDLEKFDGEKDLMLTFIEERSRFLRDCLEDLE